MNQSHDDPLVYSVDGAKPRLRGGDWRAKVALAGTGLNLVIFVIFAAFFSAHLSSIDKTKPTLGDAAHLVLDTSKLKACRANPTMDNLPCQDKEGRYLTLDDGIGPWKCTAGGSSCPAVNGSRIEVSQAGLYLLIVRTLVVDSLPSPVALLISVNDQVLAACAHNATGSSQLPCSISTVKTLRSGDRLTVRLPQAYRLINPHYSITYIDLMRLTSNGEIQNN